MNDAVPTDFCERGRAEEVVKEAGNPREEIREMAEGAKQDVARATNGTENGNGEAPKQKFRDRLRDRVQNNRDRATEHIEKAKQFLNEEYFPTERREQFIFRGKKVCTISSLSARLLTPCR